MPTGPPQSSSVIELGVSLSTASEQTLFASHRTSNNAGNTHRVNSPDAVAFCSILPLSAANRVCLKLRGRVRTKSVSDIEEAGYWEQLSRGLTTHGGPSLQDNLTSPHTPQLDRHPHNRCVAGAPTTLHQHESTASETMCAAAGWYAQRSFVQMVDSVHTHTHGGGTQKHKTTSLLSCGVASIPILLRTHTHTHERNYSQPLNEYYIFIASKNQRTPSGLAYVHTGWQTDR